MQFPLGIAMLWSMTLLVRYQMYWVWKGTSTLDPNGSGWWVIGDAPGVYQSLPFTAVSKYVQHPMVVFQREQMQGVIVIGCTMW